MALNGKLTANNLVSFLLGILILIIGWLWIQNTAEVKALTEKYNTIAEIKADQKYILKEIAEIKKDFRTYMKYQREINK